MLMAPPTPPTEQPKPEQPTPTPQKTEETTSPERQQETPNHAPAEQQEPAATEAQETSEEAQEKLQKEQKETSDKQESHKPTTTDTPQPKQTPQPSPAALTSNSATKRKFDALHARHLKGEPMIYEHEKNRSARASALMAAPSAKRAKTSPREFSFARPTASSTSRSAAIASAHARATPLPARKMARSQALKHTPARGQRASTPATTTPKTPVTAGTERRRHFNYTPYSGPLPPLTVESSFAPKSMLERGARTASPARVNVTAAGRKPRATPTKVRNTGKENVGTNSSHNGADGALNSKTHPTSFNTSTTEAPVKERSRDAFQDKVKAQRSLAQEAARSSPSPTPETTVEPTA